MFNKVDTMVTSTWQTTWRQGCRHSTMQVSEVQCNAGLNLHNFVLLDVL